MNKTNGLFCIISSNNAFFDANNSKYIGKVEKERKTTLFSRVA